MSDEEEMVGLSDLELAALQILYLISNYEPERPGRPKNLQEALWNAQMALEECAHYKNDSYRNDFQEEPDRI